MGLTRTDRSGSAGVSAVAWVGQCDAWPNAAGGPGGGTPVAMGPGVGIGVNDAGAAWAMRIQGGPAAIYRCHATASAGTVPAPSAEDTFATKAGEYDPWVWTKAAEDYSGSAAWNPLHLYYWRNPDSELAGGSGPTSPCHPLHQSQVYRLGNVDGYAKQANAELCSDETTGHILVPVVGELVGGGTCDLGTLSLGLGVTRQPANAVSGTVASLTDINWYLGSDEFGMPDFTGGRWPAEGSYQGCHLEGSATALTLVVDDWTQIPGTGTVTFSVVIDAPAVLDCYPRGRPWNKVEERGQFDVPDPDTPSGTKVVNSGDTQLLIFWHWTVTWGTNSAEGGWRPFQAQSDVNAAWAAANHEDPSPPARRVVLEGHGLNLPSFAGNEAPALWAATDIFKILLAPEINVFNPDGLGTPPVEWEEDDEELTLGRVGDVVTVTVDTLASDAAVHLDMLDVWYLYNTTAAGIEALGFPWCYQFNKHTSGYHVCNWDNRKFVRIDYDSDEAATLALEITHRQPTVTEPHVTGQARADGFEVTDDPEIVVLPFNVVAGVGQHVYVDLDIPAGRKLDHVSKVRITGFDGAEADWDFSFTGPHLRAYNPKTAAEVGRTMAMFSYNRLDPVTDKPICGTGWRFDTDGGRCCRPPDQYIQKCGEEGIDFWEWLHGDGPENTCLCHGALLAEGIQVVDHEELWSVEHAADETPPWDPDHATYQAHFVDDESGTYGGPNDCLGGVLYMWDARSTGGVYDQLLDEDGLAYVHIDVRPCGGKVYLATGVRIPFAWLHQFQGSMHGMVDDGSGARDLTNAEVNLYEHDGAGASVVATENASDWGDFQLRGEAGAREEFEEGVAVTGQTPTQWYGPVNTLRWWAGAEIPLIEREPYILCDAKGNVQRVRIKGSRIAHDRLPYPALGWREEVAVVSGEGLATPCLMELPSGLLVACWTASATTLWRTYGLAWEDAALAMMDGLTAAEVKSDETGSTHGVGVKTVEGPAYSVYYRFSDDGGVTTLYETEVAACDADCTPTVALYPCGDLMVCLTASDTTESWASDDRGQTWGQIA